jgi:hypothetical protein
MRKILILLLILTSCANQNQTVRESLSLAGEWKFRTDPLDQGIAEAWHEGQFDETVSLPGSMTENGKGDEVTMNTDWTGQVVDKSFFTEDKYEKYRQPGNIKIPFWLKPDLYYKGAAWYQKEFDLPAGWNDRNITLFLERTHWESTVYVNGKMAGTGNSLGTPHQYNISELVVAGNNTISIRIDNRVIIPVGVNAHSISDHTQSNWNGITGEISLRATPKIFISDISVYPALADKRAKVIVSLANSSGKEFRGKVELQAESYNSSRSSKVKKLSVATTAFTGDYQLTIDYPMGENPQLWSEFDPALYKLTVCLKGDNGELIDKSVEEFGMREFKANGTRFEVNGHPVFLRGTLECCIFPLTGYPPTDTESWEKVLKTCSDYGLNTIRFHSWCPPEAAFTAADKLGFYFQVECSAWATVGDGGAVDQYIYSEGDRMLAEYGNHPSFCMMAYGNEPGGARQGEYLGKLLKYWKEKDSRRLYTSAGGWPFIPENEFNNSPEPRIQRWGEGLNSIINRTAPSTSYDFHEYISSYDLPVVSHEIGQWCVYPDFKEIEKYTGVLKATNFEIFRETLEENNMGYQAEDFLMASGKLQALCYKAEIEAALRTPGFAGFHLLQLHDFPGQGSALVGILNPFFESKGYITPEEFRMFCSETVPLARMAKHVFSNKEHFIADIELAHFGSLPLKDQTITCQVINSDGLVLAEEIFILDEVNTGNCIPVGSLSYDLAAIASAEKLRLEVTAPDSKFMNNWDFWVYPDKAEATAGDVLVTDKLDRNAESTLSNGGSVLLLTYGKVGKGSGAEVAIGFSSIFWNTAWTNNQPPHTLGILCDPGHPVFSDFPTEYHSNWQWWDPVTHSQAMILDDFSADLKPLIQPIDTWFENRRLALAFEVKAGGGKLMVCSVDLDEISDERIVSRQLKGSLLNYMNSEAFNPETETDISRVKDLIANQN